MSTIMRRRRASRMQLGPYRRHELLMGRISYPVQGHTGYGDGRSTDVADYISNEMREDWAKHRDELVAFWRSGKSSATFPDNLPWLWIAGGSPDTPDHSGTPCWAERFLD